MGSYMKKTLAVVGAVALAGVLGFTAAGCSRKTRNLASLASNWYFDADFKKIQPTFTEDAAEELIYKVTQTEQSTNAHYSVKYEDGTYTTKFYAKKITATELADITLEDWREGYTKALGKAGYMYLYYYSTELSLPSVTFTLDGTPTTFENQSVVTESYFLSVEDYLNPVYSLRTVNMAVPANYPNDALPYSAVDMTYESFYSLYGSDVYTKISGTSTMGDVVKDESGTYTVGGLSAYENSVFDVSYLDVLVRGTRNVAGSFSQTVSIYSPGVEVRDYTIASNDKPVFEGENAAAQLAEVQAELESWGLFFPTPIDGHDLSKGTSKLNTVSASVTYSGGKYSGVSQNYWFAVTQPNDTRTLMVKYSEPLTYNLGRLDYVLTKIVNIA